MKHNTHAAYSRTHTLSKESQQSELSTNFQNIVNVANEDVTDDQTFVGLPTNFPNIINVANENVVNDDQTWSKKWLEEKASR